MNRILLTAFVIFSVINVTYSQTTSGFYETGYVHLKNGTVLKGKYIYSNDLEKIQVISGKNTRVFQSSEVEMISKARPSKKVSAESEFPEFVYSEPKLFNLTEAGILYGNPDNSQKAPLIVHSSLNYTLRKNLSAGVGAGVDFLKEAYLPVTANLMYKFRQSRFTPYGIVQAGYHIPLENSRMLYYDVVPYDISSSAIWPGPWPNNQTTLDAKGGFLVNPAVGFISQTNSGYGISFSVGYRFNRLRFSGENDYNVDVDYNRLSVKLGLIFN